MRDNLSKKTDSIIQTNYNYTDGVKTLLGEPKKAVIRLAIPMIAAMLVLSLYNLIDAFWVSGIGSDALAAVGFVFPFYIMMMAISAGIGIGAGSAISRRIGAKDKKAADNIAVHSIIITILSALFFATPLLILSGEIFSFIGAGKTIDMTIAYGQIIFAGAIFMFFSNVAIAILRAEGDAKRAMYAMSFGAILNMIIDPILIYNLGLGVAGAAWATLISLFITSIILIYWLLFKKDTYVSFKFSRFKFNKNIISDIFGVGLPASVSQLSMSISMLIINFIIISVTLGDTDVVAVYATGWRVAAIATLPVMGIATAVISVSGTAFGERSYDKISISHIYSVKIGLIIEVFAALITFIFAPQIAAVFTQSEGAAHIADDLTLFLRIISVFYPAISFGMLSSSVFQGVGKGISALIAIVFRAIILTTFFTILFAVTFRFQEIGIWWGIVAANATGSVIVFSWTRHYISSLTKKPLPTCDD